MNCLLDTHTLIWALFLPDELPEEITSILSKKSNSIYVSVASLWEVAIKHSRRPDALPCSENDVLRACADAGYHLIDINEKHISSLPLMIKQEIHKDPFDHLLLAVSSSEQLVLLTADKNMQKYKGVTMVYFEKRSPSN